MKNDYDISNLEDGNTDYEKVAETLINSAQEIDSCNVSFVSKLYINNRIDWYETNIIVKTNEPIKLDISKK